MTVTVDASVWIASVIASEAGHHDCALVVRKLITGEIQLVQPTLFLVEVAAALGRRFPGSGQAEVAVNCLLALAIMEEVPLDAPLAARAARYAADFGLRGAGAVYLATATLAHTTLITLDNDLVNRAPGTADVVTPQEWLTRV